MFLKFRNNHREIIKNGQMSRLLVVQSVEILGSSSKHSFKKKVYMERKHAWAKNKKEKKLMYRKRLKE